MKKLLLFMFAIFMFSSESKAAVDTLIMDNIPFPVDTLIDFGTVCVGEVKYFTVTMILVTSPGHTIPSCLGSTISSSIPPTPKYHFEIIYPEDSDSLKGDDTFSLTIKYAPKSAGEHLLQVYSHASSVILMDSVEVKIVPQVSKDAIYHGFRGRVLGYSQLEVFDNHVSNIEVICNKDTTVDVVLSNTGSADLVIDSIKCSGDTANFALLGAEYPIIIPPGEQGTLKLKLFSNSVGTISASLTVYSNDRQSENCQTVIEATKIEITVTFNSPILSDSEAVYDFGNVYVDNSVQKDGSIKNIGNLEAILNIPKFDKPFRMDYTKNSANPDDSMAYKVTFAPTEAGRYIDTIKITAQPCNLEYTIIVKGNALKNEISYLDNAGDTVTHISKTAMCDSSIIYDTIWVHNTEAYTFKALNFEINIPNYVIHNDLQLPKDVAKNGREQVIIAFTPTGEGIYENKLIFEMQDEGADEPYFDTILVTHTFRKAATNISSSKIDFGLTNICADTMTQKIVFTNTGSLQDTAIIDTYDMPSYYKVSQDTVIVPANGSTEVTLYFIPGNASHTGKSIYTLNISTIICPNQLQLSIEHELDSITLTATDADFGTLYLPASKTMDIEVVNTSKHDILLSEINLVPDVDNYTFDIALPTTIPANQSISIPVAFMADSVGNYIVDMVFTGENDCKVTAISKLTAKVLEHIYPIVIWFDTTKAAPGDMVSLSGYIEHVSPELKADSIYMIIDIDKSLFDLRNMYLHYGNPPVWQELSYENLPGNSIKASIGADVADMALHADGRFLELYGQVLLSSPRSTIISYNVFDIFTSQNYTLSKRDGLLELSGYCFPDLRDIEFTPSFSYGINEVSVNQNSMDIRFVATDNMNVALYMTNILGEEVHIDNLQLNKGDNAYTINLNNINSGIYNIRLKSKYYNNISKNIMIMK